MELTSPASPHPTNSEPSKLPAPNTSTLKPLPPTPLCPVYPGGGNCDSALAAPHQGLGQGDPEASGSDSTLEVDTVFCLSDNSIDIPGALPESDFYLEICIREHDHDREEDRHQDWCASAVSDPLESLPSNTTAHGVVCRSSCSGFKLALADAPPRAVAPVAPAAPAGAVSAPAAKPGSAAAAPTAALTSSRLGLAKRKRADPAGERQVQRLRCKGCRWARSRPTTRADGGVLACSTS